ncbi:hypothetical protein BC938DRAFT_483917 [Jimgerdemannia flammicorona]|uniref:Uncharacterized protein n=1 Tax=Jimgerdemannia flammicorona TaxID=994334 RepID=A0A433QAZ2_9FUNG|nr:hypothetical protein BC938DRAFT_483917 [Jimgerdemannia flammicorona]
MLFFALRSPPSWPFVRRHDSGMGFCVANTPVWPPTLPLTSKAVLVLERLWCHMQQESTLLPPVATARDSTGHSGAGHDYPRREGSAYILPFSPSLFGPHCCSGNVALGAVNLRSHENSIHSDRKDHSRWFCGNWRTPLFARELVSG